MLDSIVEQTDSYILSMPKDKRKSLGQFFTSKTTARFMAELFSIPTKGTVKILDPGAGSGILSAAIIEMIGFITDTGIGEKFGERFGEKFGNGNTKAAIVELMRSKPSISAKVISEVIGITLRGVEKSISELKKEGVIDRVGPPKGGHWVVK